MTTKVTIPREVADTIEYLRTGLVNIPARDNAYICELAMHTGGGRPKVTQTLRQIPFDTLMAALVNGYEREMTEEEKREQVYADIRTIYAHHDRRTEDPFSRGYCSGVLFVLDALEVKITGINEGGAA